METVKIGLIPSPDLPANIVAKIIDPLKKAASKYVNEHVDWQIEAKVDAFTGAAEYVYELVDKAANIKEEQGWDYAICLTDLPSFSKGHVVIADVNTKRGAALISLPSFGAFPLKIRIRKALVFILELLYIKNVEQTVKQTAPHINLRFLFSKVKQVVPEENESTDVRFILKSKVIGWLRALSGMTFANRPWMALASFKKILTLAFATGTYISIFSVPWRLSVAYTSPRFVLLMTLSIVGMMAWIIFAHSLWEKASSKSQSQYRKLYNLTTISTLFIISLINYAVLYILFMLSISLFVPAGIFDAWTNVDSSDSAQNFMRLAWLITSLGLLAGAVGATAEKEEKIRLITYSYRQLNRYYEIEQQAEDMTKEEVRESYAGTQQTHRESDVQ